jgi:hypothetical protein
LSELHKLRLAVEDGAGVDALVESSWPRGQFRRKDQVKVALRIWTAARLAETIVHFGKATLEARLQADLAEAITQRALMAMASTAQALGKSARR